MAEPSGAVTTAAIRTGAIKPNGPTVLIVSGGNVDDKALEDLAKFEA
jgi:threonine dehydratase